MISEQEEIQLYSEIEIGDRYRNSWELVEKFIIEKEERLYEAFKSAPSSDPALLVDIRMQHNAVDGLRQEFLSYIQTADMAVKVINVNKGKENENRK
jgi:hypothetical protein